MSNQYLPLRKLSPIQKRNNLNEVFVLDEQGPGGGYHDYGVVDNCGVERARILFQKGPRNDPDARDGVTDQDLLEIVRDRLAAFQKGSLPSRETACALTHIEEALMWLNKRAGDRAERGVRGPYTK